MTRPGSGILLAAALFAAPWVWSINAAAAPTACEPPPVWNDRPEPHRGTIDESQFDDPEFRANRSRVDRNVTPVRAYGDDHPDEFAGLFVDEFAGLVYVAFTEDLKRHTEALRSLVPDPEAVRVLPADHSLAELRAVQARIGADNLILRDLGIQVSAVGADERNNRLMVMLAELDDAAMNGFCTRYGADLFVFEEGVIHAVAAPARGLDRSGSPLHPIGPSASTREGSRDGWPWPQLVALGVTAAAVGAGLRRRRARAAETEATGCFAAQHEDPACRASSSSGTSGS